MTTARVNTGNSVRYSPLDASHERLNARWRAPGLRWPIDYGNPVAEAEAARSTAGLIDWGPLNKLVVQGTGTSPALNSAQVQFVIGKATACTVGGAMLDVWSDAPDHAILLSRHGTALPDITGQLVSAVDMSSAFTALRLIGPSVGTIFAELCPIDLGPDVLHDGQIVHGPVANVRVTFARQDLAALPGFTILVPRDYAAYMWNALIHTGDRYGLIPVGNHVLEER